MWATIGFTEKLSVDCHHGGHIVRHHYSNSLMVSGCNLNWFDTTSMELNNRQCLRLPPIVHKSLKEPVHCYPVLLAALEQLEYQALHVQIGCIELETWRLRHNTDVKKTSSKMLPSTLLIFVNDHGKFSESWKYEHGGYSVIKLPVRVLIIKYFVSMLFIWL